jgi:hypothetical protein
MLRNTLKRTNQKKNDKTCKMLGYSFEELQKHVYGHKNWGSVKNSLWHLDHIFPIRAFIDYGINDIKLINCLDNLQPLSCEENIKKNDNYSREEFEEWLKEREYEIQ